MSRQLCDTITIVLQHCSSRLEKKRGAVAFAQPTLWWCHDCPEIAAGAAKAATENVGSFSQQSNELQWQEAKTENSSVSVSRTKNYAV